MSFRIGYNNENEANDRNTILQLIFGTEKNAWTADDLEKELVDRYDWWTCYKSSTNLNPKIVDIVSKWIKHYHQLVMSTNKKM